MEPLTPDYVQSVLDEFDLNLSVVHFEDHTTTSADAARVIGCRLGQIVKSLCFLANGRPVLVTAGGDRQVSDAALAKHFGVGRKRVRIASPDTCVEVFGYAPGGVPPVAHRTKGIPVIVDRSLNRFEVLYAAAGTSHHNFALTYEQLVKITNGTVLDCVKM